MTGLDSEMDTLLEVAALVTEGDLSLVAEGPNLIIHQPDSVLDAMGQWCRVHHHESGLTAAVKKSDKDMRTCEEELLVLGRRNVPDSWSTSAPCNSAKSLTFPSLLYYS